MHPKVLVEEESTHVQHSAFIFRYSMLSLVTFFLSSLDGLNWNTLKCVLVFKKRFFLLYLNFDMMCPQDSSSPGLLWGHEVLRLADGAPEKR